MVNPAKNERVRGYQPISMINRMAKIQCLKVELIQPIVWFSQTYLNERPFLEHNSLTTLPFCIEVGWEFTAVVRCQKLCHHETHHQYESTIWLIWLITCICHTSHAVNCMNKNWGSQIQLSSLKAWDTHVEWWYSKTKSTLPLPKKKTIISFLQANIHGETPHQKPQFAD